jgi:hypothetical protein
MVGVGGEDGSVSQSISKEIDIVADRVLFCCQYNVALLSFQSFDEGLEEGRSTALLCSGTHSYLSSSKTTTRSEGA